MTENAKRKPLPKVMQLRIFRRDKWLCYWCEKPVIFAPVMKFLEAEVRNAGHDGPLAYYHAHWTRERSPLLDELGVVLDHKEAFSMGGPCSEENLFTACGKCNVRKGSASTGKWDERKKRSPIKSKYGEPEHWDGLTSVFVMLAERNSAKLTAGEREWLRAIQAHG